MFGRAPGVDVTVENHGQIEKRCLVAGPDAGVKDSSPRAARSDGRRRGVRRNPRRSGVLRWSWSFPIECKHSAALSHDTTLDTRWNVQSSVRHGVAAPSR
jgi:hypothetical protein